MRCCERKTLQYIRVLFVIWICKPLFTNSNSYFGTLANLGYLKQFFVSCHFWNQAWWTSQSNWDCAWYGPTLLVGYDHFLDWVCNHHKCPPKLRSKLINITHVLWQWIRWNDGLTICWARWCAVWMRLVFISNEIAANVYHCHQQ